MLRLTRPALVIVLVAMLACVITSCDSAALQANQAQVASQQQQIEEMQHQIEELKAQGYSPSPPPPPGSCDAAVMASATKQGGQKYADGDFSKALGYYQDALAACPDNPRAELNLGRTYQALNDQGQAQAHYQRAASSTDPNEQSAEQEARTALDRLGGTR